MNSSTNPRIKIGGGGENVSSRGDRFSIPNTPAPKSVKERRGSLERASREKRRGGDKERSAHSRSQSSKSTNRERPRSRSKHRRKSIIDSDSGDEAMLPSQSEEEETSPSQTRGEDGEGGNVVIVDSEPGEDDHSTPPGTQKNDFPEVQDQVREILDIIQKGMNGSLGRDCPSVTMKKGGQGRTGNHYLKCLRDATAQLMGEVETLRALKADMAPDTLSNGRRREEKVIEEELRNEPARAIQARLLEVVNGIDLVAHKSSNLKGEFRSKLNKAAATVKVGITQLAQRQDSNAAADPYRMEAEAERLREKVSEQERELESLRKLKSQYDDLQRELQAQREQRDRMQRTLEERDDGVTTITHRERGSKRKKPNPLSSSSEEEIETPKQNEGPEDTEMPEEAQQSGTGGPDMEKEESEANRKRIIKEIAEGGMPAAVRPPRRGKQKVMEPAVPPSASGAGPAAPPKGATADTMEERLASMLVSCVDEKVRGMEKRLEDKLRQVVDMLPQNTTAKKTSEERLPSQTSKKTPQAKEKEKAKGKKGGTQAENREKKPPNEGGKEGGPKPIIQSQGSAPPTKASGELWTKVVGRKEKAAASKQAKQQQQQQEKKKNVSAAAQQQQQRGQPKRREPRTSAVTLTCPPDMYAEHMRAVRRAIDLRTLGIDKPPNTRRTATGALSIELSGQGSAEKADALAAKMGEVLAGKEGVKVARPTMTADIRLSGFDESVTAEEIGRAVAEIAGTPPNCVTVGPISQGPRGMGTIVVKCPVKTANAVAKVGKVVLGWTRAKAEVLTKRPLQCYRCLEVGHTRATCRSETDRTGACYRCGEQGHVARGCEAPVHCTVCESKGRPANHRVGGKACPGGRGSAPPKGGEQRQTVPKPKGTGVKKGGKKTKTKKGAKPRVTSIERVSGYGKEGNVIKATVPKGQKTAGKPTVAKDKAKEDNVGRVEPTVRLERMDVDEEDVHVMNTEARMEGLEVAHTMTFRVLYKPI